MSQDLTGSFKKLDSLRQLECDTNILYILEVLNKWNNAKDNEQLKKVIDAFLEIQFYLIELKRDRDLGLKAVLQYKNERNIAIDELNKFKLRFEQYENKYFTGNSRGTSERGRDEETI